jgi:hypothetical protein
LESSPPPPPARTPPAHTPVLSPSLLPCDAPGRLPHDRSLLQGDGAYGRDPGRAAPSGRGRAPVRKTGPRPTPPARPPMQLPAGPSPLPHGLRSRPVCARAPARARACACVPRPPARAARARLARGRSMRSTLRSTPRARCAVRAAPGRTRCVVRAAAIASPARRRPIGAGRRVRHVVCCMPHESWPCAAAVNGAACVLAQAEGEARREIERLQCELGMAQVQRRPSPPSGPCVRAWQSAALAALTAARGPGGSIGAVRACL